jgi:hypothetical protein
MPPDRSRFSRDLIEQEGKILFAIQDIQNERFQSIRAAAKLYDIPYRTLTRRVNRLPSRVDIRANSYKLMQLEEDSLIEWVLSMDSCGAAPRPSTVREIANILLAARGSTTPSTVGVLRGSHSVTLKEKGRSRGYQ